MTKLYNNNINFYAREKNNLLFDKFKRLTYNVVTKYNIGVIKYDRNTSTKRISKRN